VTIRWSAVDFNYIKLSQISYVAYDHETIEVSQLI